VQSGSALAKRWEKAVTSALLRIFKNPAAGTPCTFRPAELRDVRRAPIAGFPKHLLFYRFREAEIFILRIVHGARDLENLF
jgi:toxin ParE1/3/4